MLTVLIARGGLYISCAELSLNIDQVLALLRDNFWPFELDFSGTAIYLMIQFHDKKDDGWMLHIHTWPWPTSIRKDRDLVG